MRFPSFTACLAIGVIFGFAGSGAKAATLVLYPFDNSSLASTDTDPNSAASTAVVGSGLSGSSAAGPNNAISTSQGNPASPSFFVRIAGTTASENLAVADNDYFSFTITPNSGNVLNLDSLSFNSTENVSNSSTFTFNGTIFVRSSVDGFTTDLGSYTQTAVNTGLGWTTRTINLSSVLYQGIATATTFRIYFYDDSDSTTDTAAVSRLDQIALLGTAVPEPSTAALLGLSTVLMFARRRRRA